MALPRLRVFSDGTKNYAKQMYDNEVDAWLASNPGHALVR